MAERNILIIGGGPAGYAAAIRAAQLGGKATVIEKEGLGGTCLNYGCIPTRALMRPVEILDMAAHGKEFGLTFKETGIDFGKASARKDVLVKTLVAGVRMLLKGNGVDVIEGRAHFSSPSRVGVLLQDGSTRDFTPEAVIVAAGTRCGLPSKAVDIQGGVLTTDDLLALKEIPPSMVILGGQHVGISLAAIFSGLGTKVTVVEESARLLKDIDAEIVALYEKELKRGKVQVLKEASLLGVSEGSDGNVAIRLDVKSTETVINARYLVVAETRVPNTGDLGLDKAGVNVRADGGIAVDKGMATNVPSVFAAGDVTMEHMWTPVAYAEGIVAAENSMGGKAEVSYAAIPVWVNTLPGIAAVGITEEEAVGLGYKVKVGRFLFAANGMATVLGERNGLVKVVSEEGYGQVLGVHVFGASAKDLIAEAALAVKAELTVDDVAAVFHAHPALSEAFWEATLDVRGRAIHSMSPK
jgi:dihydrolipoamide dehydrogenase